MAESGKLELEDMTTIVVSMVVVSMIVVLASQCVSMVVVSMIVVLASQCVGRTPQLFLHTIPSRTT